MLDAIIYAVILALGLCWGYGVGYIHASQENGNG